MCTLFFFFFFQAEDGIRDVAVTGVQTCALPISGWEPPLACGPSPSERCSRPRGSELAGPCGADPCDAGTCGGGESAGRGAGDGALGANGFVTCGTRSPTTGPGRTNPLPLPGRTSNLRSPVTAACGAAEFAWTGGASGGRVVSEGGVASSGGAAESRLPAPSAPALINCDSPAAADRGVSPPA